MSAIPKYTKGQINSLPIGPLREALEALGLPFNGAKLAGRQTLKAALYPPKVEIVGTGAVSQPNPRPPSQPPGAVGTTNHASASQPNIGPAPPIQPSVHIGVVQAEIGEQRQVSASQPNLSPAPLIQPSVQFQVDQAEIREQWHLLKQTSGSVYTRIPLASRNKASQVFSTLLLKCYTKNDKSAWEQIVNFPRCGLGSSQRGGKKHTSQATLVNKRLEAFVSGSTVVEPVPKKTKKAKSQTPSKSTFASRVAAKLSMGDVRGAVNIVTSKESILPPSPETKTLLQVKHPTRNRSTRIEAPSSMASVT